MLGNISDNLLLPLECHLCNWLELEILEDRALFQGYSNWVVVLVGVPNECLGNEVKVESVPFGCDLSQQLVCWRGLHNVDELSRDHIIDSRLLIQRYSQVFGSNLCEWVNELALDFENLSDSVLRVIYAHVPVDHYLMLHLVSLNVEGYCSLLLHLMIPKSIQCIVFQLYKQAQRSAILSQELWRMKLGHFHRSQVSVPCSIHSPLGH